MSSEFNPYEAPQFDPVEKKTIGFTELGDFAQLFAEISYPLHFSVKHSINPELKVFDANGRSVAFVNRKTLKLDSTKIYQDATYRECLGEVKRVSFSLSKMTSIKSPEQLELASLKRRGFALLRSGYELVKAENNDASFTFKEYSSLSALMSNQFGRLWGVGKWIRNCFKASLIISDSKHRDVMKLEYDEQNNLLLRMIEEVEPEDQYLIILSLIDLILVSRVRI